MGHWCVWCAAVTVWDRDAKACKLIEMPKVRPCENSLLRAWQMTSRGQTQTRCWKKAIVSFAFCLPLKSLGVSTKVERIKPEVSCAAELYKSASGEGTQARKPPTVNNPIKCTTFC